MSLRERGRRKEAEREGERYKELDRVCEREERYRRQIDPYHL
jgi:hypothetical protein